MLTLYRYDDGPFYGGFDHVIAAEIECFEFSCVKETKCGYWVVERGMEGFSWVRRRWVSKTSTKRYCYPSKQQAFKSYKIRKARQVQHLERQLDHAKACHESVKNMDAAPENGCWKAQISAFFGALEE